MKISMLKSIFLNKKSIVKDIKHGKRGGGKVGGVKKSNFEVNFLWKKMKQDFLDSFDQSASLHVIFHQIF